MFLAHVGVKALADLGFGVCGGGARGAAEAWTPTFSAHVGVKALAD
jgi:hypothetical protein